MHMYTVCAYTCVYCVCVCVCCIYCVIFKFSIAMKQRGPMPTVHYRFLAKNQKWIWLAMKAFSFINPFSQQVEYVVCTNVAHTR